jgi:hypothetical protein
VKKKMQTKKLLLTTISLLVLSTMLASSASAYTWSNQNVNLPSTPVTLSIVQLADGQIFPFGAVLSNFPSGKFALTPGTYTCWCIDPFTDINGPDILYSTRLYSSLDPPYQFKYTQTQLNMVNYILNHKSGTGVDVQVAILLVLGYSESTITGLGLPVSTDAIAMYTEAKAHKYYTPDGGDILGIIGVPKINCKPAQLLIIEIQMPKCGGTWTCTGNYKGCGSNYWGSGSNYWGSGSNYWGSGSNYWGCYNNYWGCGSNSHGCW